MATITPIRLVALPKELPESAIRNHVMDPPNVRNIKLAEVVESREIPLRIPIAPKKFKATPRVDLGAMGLAIHTLLKDIVVGYMLEVRKNGTLVHVGIWNWAQTPADASQGWTDDTRMHVASVSKFLTAVGVVKALKSKNISYDAKILDYLPDYWSKGSKINQITFRHLMTHTSGFATNSSSSDYAFMKGRVAAGVPSVGSYDYENMNFGLCRILLPILLGKISKSAQFLSDPGLNDKAWDAVTLYHFRNYMQQNVFTPAGVPNVGFAPTASTKNAFAYPFPWANKDGWNSGDLQTVAGGAGFRLSTEELLNVMNQVRRKNTIIPAADAQYMLDNYFGIDQKIDTPAGKIYNKNGGWGTGDGKTEQCVAYFLPDNMELALFVNSPIGTQNFSLRGIVKDTFVNSLTD
jgi:CubicO group peptidase (beta-lactamase class C family)